MSFDADLKAAVRELGAIAPSESVLAYTGEDKTLLATTEGTPCHVRAIRSANDLRLIESYPNFRQDASTYRITVPRNEPAPNLNETYWISVDGGTTKQRAQTLRRDDRPIQYWLWVQV